MFLRILFLVAVAGDAMSSEKQSFHPEESFRVTFQVSPDEGRKIAIRGEPGVDFPNYESIPRTSFRCSRQKQIPGFYADVETGCQVFHMCYEHRQESFLCPRGTIFSQPILACDYWYSVQCSHSFSHGGIDAEDSAADLTRHRVVFAVQQNPPLLSDADGNGYDLISPSPAKGLESMTFPLEAFASTEWPITSPATPQTKSTTFVIPPKTKPPTFAQKATSSYQSEEVITSVESEEVITSVESEEAIHSELGETTLGSKSTLPPTTKNIKPESVVSISSAYSVPTTKTKMGPPLVEFETADSTKQNPMKWKMAFLKTFAEKLKEMKSSNLPPTTEAKSITSSMKTNYPVLKRIPLNQMQNPESPLHLKKKLVSNYLKLLKMIFIQPEELLKSNYFIPGICC